MTEQAEEESKARKRHVHHKSNDIAGDSSHSHSASSPGHRQSQSARIRQSIVLESKKEKLQQRRIARMSMSSQQSVQKYYKALVMTALLVFMGGILHFKPHFLVGRGARHNHYTIETKFQWPPHHLAIVYPTGVSPRDDLPSFLNQYALATDENQATRDAVRHLIALRSHLKPFQIFLTGWERKKIMGKYTMDDYCGAGFERVYDHAVEKGSLRHAEDLLHWCLLHTRQNDGFVNWGVDMKRSPISTTHRYDPSDTTKGVVVKHVLHDRVHPALLWLPKKREQVGQQKKEEDVSIPDENDKEDVPKPTNRITYDMDSQVPANILLWLIQTAPTLNELEYPKKSEEVLYQMILAEGGEERWMILDAVCDQYGDDDDATIRQQLGVKYKDRRIMARDCLQGEESCCVVYLPEDAKVEREDVEPSARTSLRL